MHKNILYFLTSVLFILSCSNNKDAKVEMVEKQSVIYDGDLHLPNKYANDEFNRGMAFIHEREYIKAKQCFFNADSANPKNVFVLTSLGSSVAMTESINLSFMYFREAIETDSSKARAYIDYGYWLNKDGMFKEAIEILNAGFRRAKCSKTDFAAMSLNLAGSYNGLGNDSGALRILNEALPGLPQGKTYNNVMAAKAELEKNR